MSEIIIEITWRILSVDILLILISDIASFVKKLTEIFFNKQVLKFSIQTENTSALLADPTEILFFFFEKLV